jgi:hypothetical protein
MKWPFHLLAASIACGLVSLAAVDAAPQTFTYAVSHPRYGAIGIYVHTMDEGDGITRAQSRLRVAVKILGLVVYRQSADQTEIWQGPWLKSFQSTTITNGRKLEVSGMASSGRFLVTTPSGVAAAPTNIVASDPWSPNRIGPGTVVSTRTGRIDPMMVTGGETDSVMLHGVLATARHFHINTPDQPNKWEVWLGPRDVPLKFRSLEHGGAIDFTLISGPEPTPTRGPE